MGYSKRRFGTPKNTYFSPARHTTPLSGGVMSASGKPTNLWSTKYPLFWVFWAPPPYPRSGGTVQRGEQTRSTPTARVIRNATLLHTHAPTQLLSSSSLRIMLTRALAADHYSCHSTQQLAITLLRRVAYDVYDLSYTPGALRYTIRRSNTIRSHACT